jgi:hypothetical protein
MLSGEGETVLYEGSVRGLCPLAPNNVNTMVFKLLEQAQCNLLPWADSRRIHYRQLQLLQPVNVWEWKGQSVSTFLNQNRLLIFEQKYLALFQQSAMWHWNLV